MLWNHYLAVFSKEQYLPSDVRHDETFNRTMCFHGLHDGFIWADTVLCRNILIKYLIYNYIIYGVNNNYLL